MPYKEVGFCINCNNSLSSPKCSRCRECYLKQDKSGCNSISWKGGKLKCVSCNKTVSTYGLVTNMCRKCHNKVSGSDHWNWKGGITKRSLNHKEYKDWRKAVFERDNYICKKCSKRGGRLHAHHVVRWVDSVELRYSVNNGITLCVTCHKIEHNWNVSHDELMSVFPAAFGK